MTTITRMGVVMSIGGTVCVWVVLYAFGLYRMSMGMTSFEARRREAEKSWEGHGREGGLQLGRGSA